MYDIVAAERAKPNLEVKVLPKGRDGRTRQTSGNCLINNILITNFRIGYSNKTVAYFCSDKCTAEWDETALLELTDIATKAGWI